MTNEQMQICKIIRKYKTLKPILDKSGIEDYLVLQEQFNPGDLIFSDYEFEDDTIVEISRKITEEYEKQKFDVFYHRVPLLLSIIAIIISIFALLATIGTDSLLWSMLLKSLK